MAMCISSRYNRSHAFSLQTTVYKLHTMILTYHDGFCVRASAGDTTIVFGPISKQSKNFKPTNFGADVAFIPMNHPDMNGIAGAGRGDKQPFFVTTPGEYEIKDIAAFGFGSKSKYPIREASPSNGAGGGAEKINTIYSVTFDGLTVMYAGAVGTTELPKDIEDMDAPDVLIVPIGGAGAPSASEWQQLGHNLAA